MEREILEMNTEFKPKNLKECNYFQILNIEKRIILKYIIKTYGTRLRTGFISPMIWKVDGGYEKGNESSVCIKGGKFIDPLSHYELLKNNYAAWN
jgi:hypothetical protein